MDSQNQQQPTSPQASVVIPLLSPAEKPQLDVTDREAQALLAINNIETGPHTKLKLPIPMMLTVAVLIILVVLASFMLGNVKGGNDDAKSMSGAGTSSSNQTTPTTGTGVDNQVNQDVNQCSNVVNAVSEC